MPIGIAEVELRVDARLEADFDKHKHLLPGRELSRQRDGEHVVLTWLAPEAPAHTVTMSPWFTLHEGRIELGGIEYYDAAGTRLT
ncbi:hypothetical protein ACFVFF_23280 [Streptomyces sp. NPDC057680]|uniref:hypothetical protein n=1 Tax=Streptomyces sp. NPDC057680 TaxID=3346208 RepID=UPI0036C2CEF9